MNSWMGKYHAANTLTLPFPSRKHHSLVTMSHKQSELTPRRSIGDSQITPNLEQEDLELNRIPSAYLINNVVQSFAWKSMNVTVKNRVPKSPLSILHDANGLVKAGEMLAIMGKSDQHGFEAFL